MILLIFFSIFITLILNILLVKKIKNKTNRLVLYFSNIIFSIIFILLLLICNFSSVGLNYLVDKQIERLELKVNEYYPNALIKQFDTTQIKTIFQEVLSAEKSETDIIQNIIYDSISEISSSALNIISTVDNNKNSISIKDALINIKQLSLNRITPYITLIKNITIAFYVIYLIISIILSFIFMKDTEKESSGIVFGDNNKDIKAGVENKF